MKQGLHRGERLPTEPSSPPLESCYRVLEVACSDPGMPRSSLCRLELVRDREGPTGDYERERRLWTLVMRARENGIQWDGGRKGPVVKFRACT